MYTGTALFKNKPGAAGAAPAAQPLLDAVGVGAIAALGFYKLRTAYTGDCIRVRRISDNSTSDIGFTATGEVDSAAIATFCTGTTGTITIWYDQSGNSFDFNMSHGAYPGGTGEEPIIYYAGAVTTDAAGNIAAYSANPGYTGSGGSRFINSPVMTSRTKPTITFFAQINYYNSNGIIHTELANGYNVGTYGVPANNLSVIQSNGSNLGIRTRVETNATDPFASTIKYSDTGQWYITSHLNAATPFNKAGNFYNSFNASTYQACTIFRYYSASLMSNCAISGYIYWDIASNADLTATQIDDLYTWVETNLGYTNNAP